MDEPRRLPSFSASTRGDKSNNEGQRKKRDQRKKTLALPDSQQSSSHIVTSNGTLIPVPSFHTSRKVGFALYWRLFAVACIYLGDMISDISVAYLFTSRGDLKTGRLMFGFIFMEKILQAVVAFHANLGSSGVLLALLGFHPIQMSYKSYTTPRSYTDRDTQIKCAKTLDTDDSFTDFEMAGKLVRLTMNSLPLLTVQFYLCLSYRLAPVVSQYISLSFTFVLTGFLLVRVEMKIDFDPIFNMANPRLCGFIPRSFKGALVTISALLLYLLSSVFISTFTAIVVFVTSRAYYFVLAFSVFGFYTLMRILYCRNWWYPSPKQLNVGIREHFQSAIISFLLNVVASIVVVFLPLTAIRVPAFLTPRGYLIMRFVTIVCAIVAAPLALQSEDFCKHTQCYAEQFLRQNGTWIILTAIAVNVLSGLTVLMTMNRKLLHSFTSFLNWDVYVNGILWYESEWHNWGNDMDAHRALVLKKFSHWPREDVIKAWLHERWDILCREKPLWFCDAWRAMLPPSVLPPCHLEYIDEQWDTWEAESPAWFTPSWKADIAAFRNRNPNNKIACFTDVELAVYAKKSKK